MSEIRILLADDHPLIREGVRGLLNGEDGMRVIGETGDGLDAVTMAERLRPDVLVVDLMMPGLSGLEVARQIRERAPAARVILLTMHDSENTVQEAFRNGASGYVLKDAAADELIAAVRAAAGGSTYLSASLSERAVRRYVDQAKTAVPSDDPYETLSEREREVLHLAAEGRTSAEIGDRLFISQRTAETHRAAMLRKLGLRTQTDLVRFAIRRGILPLDA